MWQRVQDSFGVEYNRFGHRGCMGTLDQRVEEPYYQARSKKRIVTLFIKQSSKLVRIQTLRCLHQRYEDA